MKKQIGLTILLICSSSTFSYDRDTRDLLFFALFTAAIGVASFKWYHHTQTTHLRATYEQLIEHQATFMTECEKSGFPFSAPCLQIKALIMNLQALDNKSPCNNL